MLALELLLKVGIRWANEVFEPPEKCVEPSVCQAEAIAYQIEGLSSRLSQRFEPDGVQVSVKVPASATNCVTRVVVVCVRAWCVCVCVVCV